MVRLKIKKYNMILIETLQKYLPYLEAKLISMDISSYENILQVKKNYLLTKK